MEVNVIIKSKAKVSTMVRKLVHKGVFYWVEDAVTRFTGTETADAIDNYLWRMKIRTAFKNNRRH